MPCRTNVTALHSSALASAPHLCHSRHSVWSDPVLTYDLLQSVCSHSSSQVYEGDIEGKALQAWVTAAMPQFATEVTSASMQVGWLSSDLQLSSSRSHLLRLHQ